MSVLKDIAKEILYRSLFRVLKKVTCIFLPFVLLSLLAIVVILAVFGAAPVEEEDPARAEVENYVESMEVESRCKYRQEDEFRLPWGIVYSVECYAGEWQMDPDMTRVKRVCDSLRPEFEYMEYTEEKIVTTIYYSETGSTSHTERYEETVELLEEVNTYEGKYLLKYEEITEVDRKAFRDGEGKVKKVIITEYTYMKPNGREYIQDYLRFDNVIAAEIGSIQMYYTGEIDVSEGKFTWPVPESCIVTSPFGMRYHPVLGEFRMHNGIDIAVNTGDGVIAAADGLVRFAGECEGYGDTVVLDHEDGYTTLYGHNSKLLVRKGEKVSCGQKIAEAGSTGVSTGPHLHFEVGLNGEFLNPLGFLQLPQGISVSEGNNPDRRMVLETAWAFMQGRTNLEWLLK